MSPDQQTAQPSPQYYLRRALWIAIVLVLLLYLCDFAWFELRLFVPKLGQAKGSVHRIRLLAIPNKNGKYNFEIDTVRPEEDLPCAHSLFPHAGSHPCWYVTRHANDPILM